MMLRKIWSQWHRSIITQLGGHRQIFGKLQISTIVETEDSKDEDHVIWLLEIITINWVTSSTATCGLCDSNKKKGNFLSPICHIKQTAFNLRFCVYNVSWSCLLAIKERFLIVKPSMLKIFVASALRASFIPSLIFWHYEIYIKRLQIAFLFPWRF